MRMERGGVGPLCRPLPRWTGQEEASKSELTLIAHSWPRDEASQHPPPNHPSQDGQVALTLGVPYLSVSEFGKGHLVMGIDITQAVRSEASWKSVQSFPRKSGAGRRFRNRSFRSLSRSCAPSGGRRRNYTLRPLGL